MMKSSFSVEDIKSSLFKMPLNRTPGPDGFPVEFFKRGWEVLGEEITVSVQNFFLSPFMPKALNSTSLILIPKRRGADELKDFRPISCLNTIYKLISRLLSDRLKRILPKLILPNQTAFIKDRLLLENVFLAAEVIKGYHRQNLSPRITLKVDIAKAFDSMRWDFILTCLSAYKLPAEFNAWIKKCISTPSFSVSINGITSGYFKGKTGLRQGDPLSPILFVMAMNILSIMLNKAAEEGIFKLHPDCENVQLTHLAFADDLLIFLEGSADSVDGVLKILAQFEKMSGLAVNITKTSMFCSGVSTQVLNDLRNRFSLEAASLPIRYLGLPLSSKKLSVNDCDPLISKIRMKMSSWMHRPLSFAGRLTLLSSVISGLIVFWTQAFFLPKTVIRQINSLSSSFLWHGKLDCPTGAKVSWSEVCYPKAEGGLGIRSISSWNEVCGLKLLWMLFFKSGSIWVAWMRNRYLSRQSFWSLNQENPSFSWTFRKILKLRHKASSFLRILIGSGEETFFWWDPWTPFGPLISYLGPQAPAIIGIPQDALVKDCISDLNWILPPARSDHHLEVFSFISSVAISNSSDYPVWIVEGCISKEFNSKVLWNIIRESKPKVPWYKLVWNNVAIPKHSTNAWLFILDRNPTLSRLLSWGLDVEESCLLCGHAQESRDHLFFSCPYSLLIWKSVMVRIRCVSVPISWSDSLLWVISGSSSSTKSLAMAQGWQASIYEIWRERNRRYHEGNTSPPIAIVNRILSVLKNRAVALKSLSSCKGDPLLRLWEIGL
ncbi:unnamed protein product [Microthlaspi erraticum]|uniref:Reverse transcriptase domain-containing protein n=1 Tax=Microthlaspi erraticum TaxID=1685480 RepID=A0A6D2K1E2_9BRAS|nr:unnamed protein product [Microthlaspi erraticum]